MTDREKLIELLSADPCGGSDCCTCERIVEVDCYREQMADYLIANGVTFATDTNDGGKWISVEDRLPIECEDVLVYIDDPDMAKGEEYTPNNIGFIENGTWYYSHELFEQGTYAEILCITHWMPLPEPPKEG